MKAKIKLSIVILPEKAVLHRNLLRKKHEPNNKVFSEFNEVTTLNCVNESTDQYLRQESAQSVGEFILRNDVYCLKFLEWNVVRTDNDNDYGNNRYFMMEGHESTKSRDDANER